MALPVPGQLPLKIEPGSNYAAETFVEGESNKAARAWLERTEVWPDRRLALWGEPDRGKTHLLRIWAERTGAEVMDGPALTGFPTLASEGGAAVDDADRADEAALLHLLNTARDLGRPVLLAGRAPPARWPTALRDLASRLRAVTAVEILAPDDTMMRELLLHWLTERRLVAGEPLHVRLLRHLPRSPSVLRAAVARLDADATASRRRTVSAAMLRAALAQGLEDDDSANFSPETAQCPSPEGG